MASFEHLYLRGNSTGGVASPTEYLPQCAQPVGRDSKQLLCERPFITSGLLFSWKCCSLLTTLSLVREERSSLATGWLESMLQSFKGHSYSDPVVWGRPLTLPLDARSPSEEPEAPGTRSPSSLRFICLQEERRRARTRQVQDGHDVSQQPAVGCHSAKAESLTAA